MATFAESITERIRAGKTRIVTGNFTAGATSADITPGLSNIYYGDFTVDGLSAVTVSPVINVTSTAGVMHIDDGLIDGDLCTYICIGR